MSGHVQPRYIDRKVRGEQIGVTKKLYMHNLLSILK